MSEDGVKKSSNPMVALTTGCIAGGIEAIAVWPMENIKTQLQLQTKVMPGEKAAFDSILGGLVYTTRTTGFLSLYNGLGITLIGSIPKAGIRFGGNAWCKKQLADKNGKLNMGQQFLAGMGAGTIEAVVAVTPMETVKTKLIQRNLGLVEGCVAIMRESGIAGFYQGVSATVLKQASNQGLRFMFFNKYKDLLTDRSLWTPTALPAACLSVRSVFVSEKGGLSPVGSLIGGMLAGCFSVLGNNPFDVVKTQMQGANARLYKNTIDCFVQIVRGAGLSGLYRGMAARMARVVPGQGIIFMSFESIQCYVERTFFAK